MVLTLQRQQHASTPVLCSPRTLEMAAIPKSDVTHFACVSATDQCLWFDGCASTLWIGGGVGILDPPIPESDVGSLLTRQSVHHPSVVHLPGLTQPQIKPMTSNLQFLVHPTSHCPLQSFLLRSADDTFVHKLATFVSVSSNDICVPCFVQHSQMQ